MRAFRLLLALLSLVTVLGLGPAAAHHALVIRDAAAATPHGCCPGAPPADRQPACPHLPILAAVPLPVAAVLPDRSVAAAEWGPQRPLGIGRRDAPEPPPPRLRRLA